MEPAACRAAMMDERRYDIGGASARAFVFLNQWSWPRFYLLDFTKTRSLVTCAPSLCAVRHGFGATSPCVQFVMFL